MKEIFLAILAIVAAVNISVCALAEENALSTRATVFYFHTTFRCYSCSMIENYTKEAIEKNFKDELEEGSLSFQEVNMDDKDNQKYVRQYQLYNKAVVLSLIKEGKEVKFKNLDKIWQLVRNKQGFMDYVADEIRSLLKESL